MKAQKIAAVGIYDERNELTGVVVRDIPSRKYIMFTCIEKDEDEIMEVINSGRSPAILTGKEKPEVIVKH